MQPTIASQWSRRAFIAGSTASACSSMNSIVATMMSALAIDGAAGFQRRGIVPIGGGVEDRAQGRRSRAQAAPRAIDRARQMIVERDDGHAIGRATSAAEMGFRVIQRPNGDGRQAALARELLGVAARLAAHEERNLLQLLLRVLATRARRRGAAVAIGAGAWRGGRRDATGPRLRGTPRRRGTSRADALRAPSSADGPRCRRSRWRLRSPFAASSAPENPARAIGAEITAQGMPSRLAMWRSICVPSTSSGAARGDRGFDFEIIVGDQRLDAVSASRARAPRGRIRGE